MKLALVERFVAHYNTVRLHSAIGYIAPADFLAQRGPVIWAERDRRLEAAREVRRIRRAERYGNTETCTKNGTQAGYTYVMLRGYTTYSGVSLVAAY